MEPNRDNWSTPTQVYEAICRFWKLQPVIDVCADAKNSKCNSYFGLERHNTSAFDIDWVGTARSRGWEPIFWMNPPYSQPLMTQFIQEAIKASKQGGATLFLLPAWVDQGWYHDLIKPYPHEFWKGRIKFIPPPGMKPSSPRYGNVHGVIRRGKVSIFERYLGGVRG